MKEKILPMKVLNEHLPTEMKLRFHLCGTTYPNSSYLINRPHSHFFCIEYIVSGKGTVQINGQSFSPCAGDTYFLTQGDDHFYHSDRREPWEKIWINLSGQYLTELAEMCGIRHCHHYPNLDTSDILMKLQYYAEHPQNPASAEKCVGLIIQLFLRLSRAKNGKAGREPTAVERMLAYIELHEAAPISLEQLAAACKKSPSQAERLFRREVGMPPYRYALNRRLELACQLLRETGMQVRDIAAYLSFEDEFYFSGLFRRKIGVSPTEYRKQQNDATQSLQKETETE